uniref:Putative secreted protein n=1 Tax=Panstrongylus lignarius TaxID=156445 RepID=A0A224XVT0_9HEMI
MGFLIISLLGGILIACLKGVTLAVFLPTFVDKISVFLKLFLFSSTLLSPLEDFLADSSHSLVTSSSSSTVLSSNSEISGSMSSCSIS